LLSELTPCLRVALEVEIVGRSTAGGAFYNEISTIVDDYIGLDT